MLRMLRIRDLAIIEERELTLEPRRNLNTRETGAG
jgi:DNA repair ATPase RecN